MLLEASKPNMARTLGSYGYGSSSVSRAAKTFFVNCRWINLLRTRWCNDRLYFTPSFDQIFSSSMRKTGICPLFPFIKLSTKTYEFEMFIQIKEQIIIFYDPF